LILVNWFELGERYTAKSWEAVKSLAEQAEICGFLQLISSWFSTLLQNKYQIFLDK
jgi:hypothetical protein